MEQCLLCQQSLTSELTLLTLLTGYQGAQEQFCQTCLQKFQEITGPICPGCGRMSGDARLCQDCQTWQDKGETLIENRALYVYNQQMKDYMARYKFIGDYRLRVLFKGGMRKQIRRRMRAEKIDMVTSIPISSQRLQTRGFNQVHVFIPISKGFLEPLTVSDNHKVDQSSKTRVDRLQTTQPFEFKEGMEPWIRGRRILLVDDVYTTGRTLYHASALLKSAGAAAVFSMTLAR